jgi:hypothetical protein
VFTLLIPNHMPTTHAQDFSPTLLGSRPTTDTYNFCPPYSHLLKWSFSGANLVTPLLSPFGVPWPSDRDNRNWQTGFPRPFFFHKIPSFLQVTCFVWCLLHVISCLAYSSTLKTGVTRSYEMLVDFQQTAQGSQKTELFITTSVKNPTPTNPIPCHCESLYLTPFNVVNNQENQSCSWLLL